jgi:hypothetical protein
MFKRLSLLTVTEHFPKSRPAVTSGGQTRMSIRATNPYESGLETTFGNVEADALAGKEPSVGPENFCHVIRASAWPS